MILISLSIILFGCSASVSGGGDGDQGSCTAIDSPTCATAPDYATEIEPIIDAYCVSCHQQGGEEPKELLTSYAEVQGWSSDIARTVEDCSMPPPEDAQMSDEERTLLLEWIACGAPQVAN